MLGLSCGLWDLCWITWGFSLIVACSLRLHARAYFLGGMWDFSSPTRDWTRVPCTARWTFNPWATREVSVFTSLLSVCCWHVSSSRAGTSLHLRCLKTVTGKSQVFNKDSCPRAGWLGLMLYIWERRTWSRKHGENEVLGSSQEQSIRWIDPWFVQSNRRDCIIVLGQKYTPKWHKITK